MTTIQAGVPVTDVDIFAEPVSLNPFEAYRQIRDLGQAVWMARDEYWLVTRYDDVKAVLRNHEDFISGQGLAYDEAVNAPVAGEVVLASDPPVHTRLREHLMDKLSPKAMRKIRGEVQAAVDAIVDAAVAKGEFDAVPAIAQAVPVKIVGDLLGLPTEGRHLLLKGSDAVFSSFAPLSPEVLARLPHAHAYFKWIDDVAARHDWPAGSWGESLAAAVDRGELTQKEMAATISALLVAGFDTTVNSIGMSIRFFATEPGLWSALKADPGKLPSIFEETVRMDGPVVAFFRRAARNTEIGGTPVAAGDRVCLVYTSANHDERHYPEPDRFDIDRNPVDHLAMSHGIHACAGSGLARVEAFAVSSALLERVEKFELAGEPVRHYNPVIRGLESLPIRVTPLAR